MSFNDGVIETFRANGGEVNSPMRWGRSLVLVHVAKKDGSTLVLPLYGIAADGGWHVAATAGGAEKDPAWAHGLRRMDRTVIEVPGDPVEEVPVSVTQLAGAERDAIWARFLEVPGFASYEEKAGGREFPIFRFFRI